MTRFGAEFTNVKDIPRFPPEVAGVSEILNALSAEPAGWLYFGPRGYRIEEGATVIFEAHHTLWFARGAYLDLEDNVTLIIRGGVRADPYTIFRLRDVYALSINILGRTEWPDPDTVSSPNTVIRFEGTRVRKIFPEWFGVQPGLQSVDSSLGPASARAFQACVNAACRDRVRTDARGHAAESLPPLPIETQSILAMNSTIEALPDANGRGALWLAGRGDASTRNLGLPSLVRLPASARINVGATRVERDLVEKTRSALLRVHPRVSAQISGVGMRCEGATRGADQPSDDDVENVVLIEEAADSNETKLDPALNRHVYFDRCGISGGRRAALSVRPYHAALPPPRSTSAWRRRSVGQRSTRVGVRDCTFDGVLIPGDGGDRPEVSSRMIIEVDGPLTTSLDLSGGKVHQVVRALVPLSRLPQMEAGLLVRGASVYVHGVSFHIGEGPRPSRPNSGMGQLALPDGQDIWLDAADGSRAPHLTVLHADSQSWWFLGGTLTRPGHPGSVCLINVGANDVNLKNSLPERREGVSVRRDRLIDAEQGERIWSVVDSLEANRLLLPPSIAWPGGAIPLLLEGCRFLRYVTIGGPRTRLVANVGTTFFTPLSPLYNNWFPPEVIPLHGQLLFEGREIPSEMRQRLSSGVQAVVSATGAVSVTTNEVRQGIQWEPAALPILARVPGDDWNPFQALSHWVPDAYWEFPWSAGQRFS